MNVFISHAWRDKTAAQRIADALRNGAEVWLDVQRLKPGDDIQAVIDHALEGMDVVVVLWSHAAADSKGVEAEIRTAVRLKKKILPVLLDEAPPHELLRDLYGINFRLDEPGGVFRVQTAILRLMVERAGMDAEAAAALNQLTTMEGFYQYVQEFRNRKEIGGEDSAEWALRMMEQGTQAFQATAALRDQVGGMLDYLQGIMARVEAAGDDAAAIRSILDEVVADPRSQSRELQVLANSIRARLSALEQAGQPPRAWQSDAADAGRQFAERVERQAGAPAQPAPAAAPADPAQQAALALIQAYVQEAPQALQRFSQAAAVLPSQALRQVSVVLNAYLSNPHDLVPDQQHGLLGLADDAWLIHNTIYRCVEAGLFAADVAGVDWSMVVQADTMVVRLLPPPIRATLEQLLMSFMQAIALEQASYQPGFAPGADPHSYAAWMGGGEAVGQAYSGPQTVDDLFVSGGTVSWVGKTW